MPRWSDDEAVDLMEDENFPDMVDILNRIENQEALIEEFPPEESDDQT